VAVAVLAAECLSLMAIPIIIPWVVPAVVGWKMVVVGLMRLMLDLPAMEMVLRRVAAALGV
jgi:hypothetical protein